MRRLLALIILLFPFSTLAAPSAALLDVYASRPDLQAAFDPTTFEAIPGSRAGDLFDLEAWARAWGWREDGRLVGYRPTSAVMAASIPTAEDLPEVTAHAYMILDRETGEVLSGQNVDEVWPIASLTKLVTAQTLLNSGVSMDKNQAVLDEDDVGGAKLYVNNGETFSISDLMYAMLVGSANNAAHALSRSAGIPKEHFIASMNTFADSLGLTHTTFVDPSGIELGNASTVREMGVIAQAVFENKEMRRYTSTAVRSISALVSGESKKITNTNWMLWKPEYDDVFVMSGKTGYLEESGWNLVVSLRPELTDADREVLLVLFGSASRSDSFKDARALAEWAWEK